MIATEAVANRPATALPLEKAYEDHSAWLIWLNVDTRFDTLHADQRYHDLLRRMGL